MYIKCDSDDMKRARKKQPIGVKYDIDPQEIRKEFPTCLFFIEFKILFFFNFILLRLKHNDVIQFLRRN